MKYDYLRWHAIKNVWCAPSQDRQFIFKLHRISPSFGYRHSINLHGSRYTLPKTDRAYHVFSIGRMSPSWMEMLEIDPYANEPAWINLKDVIADKSLFSNVYSEAGVEILKIHVSYMYIKEGATYIAIEDSDKYPIDLGTEDLFFRVYTNAYYGSSRDVNGIDTAIDSRVIASTDDVLQMQTKRDSWLSHGGAIFTYVNGIYHADLRLSDIRIGDLVEIQYDGSVRVVYDFDVSQLPTFTSTLDMSNKYLLVRDDSYDGTINYVDDVDVYVVDEKIGNRYGLYLNRHDVTNLRMVTHRDYSLNVTAYQYHATQFKDILNKPNSPRYIRIIVRESGLERPLIYENNRIHELYKLPRDKRLAAMTNSDGFELWKAYNLENSAYTLFMGKVQEMISDEDIESLYGYNAMTVYTAQSPVKAYMDSGQKKVDIPVGYRDSCTLYQYDVNGVLITTSYSQGLDKTFVDPQCDIVEFVYGRGSSRPSMSFGTNNIALPSKGGYRVYMCYLDNGLPNEEWQDVTGTSFYKVENNVLINNNVSGNEYFMVRSDQEFMTQDVTLSETNGVYFFTLAEEENRGNGYQLYTMPVPAGELDVFLNGRNLVRGLDYILQFPKVIITNKKYLTGDPQRVHVRFTGFARSDLTIEPYDDYGFVYNGVLSHNTRYDVRDDKVVRLYVDGQIKMKSDVTFSEDTDAVSVPVAYNGTPYRLSDITIPLVGYTVRDPYTLKAEAEARDKQVEDYLSIKKPEIDRSMPLPITQRHLIYSPFMSRIIAEMNDGVLNDLELMTLKSDNDYIQKFSPYNDLLEIDPAHNDVNDGFVLEHPHPFGGSVSVSALQYRVLEKLNELYFKNRIPLTPFVTITA